MGRGGLTKTALDGGRQMGLTTAGMLALSLPYRDETSINR